MKKLLFIQKGSLCYIKVIVRNWYRRLGVSRANCLLHEALLAVTVRVLQGVELVKERSLLVLSTSGTSGVVASGVLALADVVTEALTSGLAGVGAGQAGASRAVVASGGTSQAGASGGTVTSTGAGADGVLTLAKILTETLASGAGLAVTSLAGETGASVRAGKTGAGVRASKT